MNRGVWVTGLCLMVAPFLISTLWFAGSGTFDAFVEAIIFTFVIGPIMFVVGLVLLIVGLATGSRQQQQQQVVVMSGDSGRFCTNCGGAIESGHRFCAGCGVSSG